MKFTKLLEQLYSWENDLKEYIIVFERNDDIENLNEAKILINTLNDFLDIYLQIEENKKDEFYDLVFSWSNINQKYMLLFKDLYEAYLKKEKSLI